MASTLLRSLDHFTASVAGYERWHPLNLNHRSLMRSNQPNLQDAVLRTTLKRRVALTLVDGAWFRAGRPEVLLAALRRPDWISGVHAHAESPGFATRREISGGTCVPVAGTGPATERDPASNPAGQTGETDFTDVETAVNSGVCRGVSESDRELIWRGSTRAESGCEMRIRGVAGNTPRPGFAMNHRQQLIQP